MRVLTMVPFPVSTLSPQLRLGVDGHSAGCTSDERRFDYAELGVDDGQ